MKRASLRVGSDDDGLGIGFELASADASTCVGSTHPRIHEIAEWVVQRSAERLRVAVDGYSAAGKTTFGHELAAAVQHLGRPTLRAGLDDFKHPWRHSREHGYDRVSEAGYYTNAHDHTSVRDLLLIPAGPHGTGRVVLCAHDPLTGEDHRNEVVMAPPDAVLIVDSVFAFRPEYNDFWDYRIWLDIDIDISLEAPRIDQER